MTKRKRLIIGVACGVLSIVFVLLYASSIRAEERAVREDALARYGGDQVEVCVATRDISIGEKLGSSNTTTSLWVADLLPEDCITSSGDLDGATAGSTILANEPISRRRLDSGSTEVEVPQGLCAVSIPSQDVRAVGGAISRGSLVNVYASTETGTVLLGENLLVLETSNSSQETTGARSALAWVTLAVTPNSVQELLNASRAGNLYLTLPASPEGSTQDVG